jgi:23S rRNA pseudouridine2605 synthase
MAIQHQFHQPTASYNNMYPGGSATRLLFSLHPSQMRYHQTSLKSTNDAEEEPAKKKQKSRKQRMRIAKQFPMQRIDKVLANRGLGTRSKTFELAKSGRIATASHENVPFEERTVIRGPSEKVRSNAIIFIDGKLIPGPTPLLMAYHKPKWMLSVMEDDKKYQDQERRHLGQVLAPRYVRSGMHPVGRLDYDTSGLILFSSDGKLTNKLLHPKQGIEKEYVATVKGEVNMEELKHKLAEGVETTEGVHTAILLEVLPSEGPSDEEDPRKRPEGNEDGEDEFIEKADDYDGPYSDVRLIVSEGKYRMVRRMLHNCGHSVVELRRERHGAVRLDLKVGEFREASEEELEWANKLL